MTWRFAYKTCERQIRSIPLEQHKKFAYKVLYSAIHEQELSSSQTIQLVTYYALLCKVVSQYKLQAPTFDPSNKS